MGCDSPLKGWRDRDTGGLTFRREQSYGEKMEVGCGQCLGCRLDYRRMWAMRITHEASMHEYNRGNCFVTLTYRDKYLCNTEQLENFYHVPDDWGLHKSHFTNFMKRLRKYFVPRMPKGLNEDEKENWLFENGIRYFYAGEYGRKCQHGIDVELVGCPLCNVGRPHFHACLFNCSFNDLEPYQSDGGIIRYTSPLLASIWKYGFVDVGELNFGSASYVAGYVLKKMKGPTPDDWYMHYDVDGVMTFVQPEFVGMSRGNAAHKGQKCGIGAGWYERYKSDVFPSNEVPVPGHGVMHGVPRYYDEILKEQDPEMYEQIKDKRREFLAQNKDEYTFERLMDKHKCKLAREKRKEKYL